MTSALRAHALDTELAALVQGLGAPLVAARELTTLPSPVLERPAWRIELADGRLVKGRVFPDLSEAERFAALAACLPSPGFPALLARSGRAALLAWIPGAPMPALPPAALLRRAGELLGRLHRQPLPSDAETRLASPVSALPEPLGPRIEELIGAGWLERREGEVLAALAERAFPPRCERGLVHLDFCAENLVVGADGAPWAIDNATLCLAPLDYDLARTALRWPLPPAARQAFLDGYAAWRDPAAFEAHADYWRVCAGVHSARLRLLRRSGDVAAPIAALRRMLQARRSRARSEPQASGDQRNDHARSSHLAYGDCRLEACADAAADRAWLRDFLAPWFEEREDAAPGAARVALVRDAAAFAAARAAGAEKGAAPVAAFLADGAALELTPWRGAPARWYDAGADAFLEREAEGRWRVLAAPGAHFARVAWMRVLRELATLHAARSGAALLHASAVERAGAAIAFAGAKRSGKTSCLLSALRAPGVRFLANDRLCAEPGAVARGMPTIVSLRADALDAFPELAQRVRAADPRVATRPGESRAGQPEWKRKPGYAGVATAEFLALAGVAAARSAPLRALVFPHVSGRPGSYALERLAPQAARAALDAADLLRAAPQGVPFGAHRADAGTAVRAELAGQVPCIACRLDLDARAADPARFLDEIEALAR